MCDLRASLGAFFRGNMIDTILATKKDMGQAFIDGKRIPTTKLVAGPCVVTQIIDKDKNGYWGLQLGFGEKKIKNTTKPLRGHLKKAVKAGEKFPRFLREMGVDQEPEAKVGDPVAVSDIFVVGDKVIVTATSKGKGFAGGMKRWGFKGGPATHGQSDRARAIGSIGQGTTPGRVHKGKKMPGRMGTDTVTVKNLKVLSIDEAKNEILVSGPVPGPRGGLVIVKK